MKQSHGVKSPTATQLEDVLKYGGSRVSRQDREKMESFWDSLARYGSLTAAQARVVTHLYEKLKLDDPKNRRKEGKVGVVRDASIGLPRQVSTLLEFEKALPHLKGTAVWKRVAAFLAVDGHVVELRPEGEASK